MAGDSKRSVRFCDVAVNGLAVAVDVRSLCNFSGLDMNLSAALIISHGYRHQCCNYYTTFATETFDYETCVAWLFTRM